MIFWKKPLLFCAFVLFPTTTLSFNDISPDDPQQGTFLRMQEMGIMHPDSFGNIAPNRVPTRAEALTIALRAGGIPLGEYNGETYYNDVNPNEWYASVVAKAVEKRVIINKNELFRPQDAVTKAEFLAFLFRATRVKFGPYFSKTKFVATDIPEDAWFAPHFAYAKKYQIAHLPIDNHYRPYKYLTRREIAMITERRLKLYHGDKTTAHFVELKARMDQFIILLRANNHDEAQSHLQRIIELTNTLSRTNNNQDVLASQAIALAMEHFTDGLRALKSQRRLNAIENLHLAAKQAERAANKSVQMEPFANELQSVITETLNTFYTQTVYQ